MLQIGETIISLDVFEEKFACDLNSCKGICCIEGDAGAPLEIEEVEIINKILPVIWNELSEKSKEVIDGHGISYIDEDGEPVTSIVDGKECVFTYSDEKGVCKCVFEKAYKEGRIDFYKPISCHLYPIRLLKYKDFTAVNYHKWKVCDCARELGGNLKVPVYKFLKDSLVRKFGIDWYEQLEIAAQELR